MTDSFKLFRFEDDIVKDQWGFDVPVARMVEVVDVGLVAKREYDNGYEKVMIDVAVTWEGRTFYRPIEIDYWTGATWYEDVRQGEGFRPFYRPNRLPIGRRLVDAAGNPVTPDQLRAAFG